MDLKTAVYVLVQQVFQLSDIINQLQSQANNARDLMNFDNDNSIPAISPQIHALASSMDITMIAMGSASVIVQQYIDEVSRQTS